jgi:PAS domain S-box-containing protein
MKAVPVTVKKVRPRAVAGKDEQELAPFFDLALDMLCIAGSDGYFKRVNPAFMKTLGYSEEELLSTPFVEFVHPEDLASTFREMEKLRHGEETVFFTNRYRHRNGGYCWIEWNAAPAGEGRRIYAAARDITKRRRADERFRLVVNAAPNGVIMVTSDGEIILSNPRAEMIAQLPAGGLDGRRFLDLLPRKEREPVMQAIRECFREAPDEFPATRECLIGCSDGSLVPVSLTFTLVATEVESFVLIVIVDLSERWQTQRQLKQSEEQVQRSARELHEMRLLLIQAEKMDSMGRLAAGVAHEVKNPLAMLQLGLELMERRIPDEDERAQSVLKMMQEAIERANRIVSEMLDMARTRDLELDHQDVNELVREAEQLCRHQLITSKIEVREELGEAPMVVHVDRAKLLQVLINLVMNAIYAMAGGGVLSLRTERATMGEVARDEGARTSDHLRAHDRVVVICIEDTGSGIDESVAHRIFEPFFTTKPTGQGTGLGLAVAKSIIELHGGVISLENRKRAGVRVTISLPASSGPHLTPTSKGHAIESQHDS